MKKIILSVITVVTFTVLSQVASAQVKVGIIAGANLSNLQGAGVGSKLLSTGAFTGNHAGFIADVKLTDHVYVQPQLMFSQKGAKYTDGHNGAKTKLTMNSIEMPVNILYKVEVSGGKIFAGGGPVLGYNFSGKQQQYGQSKKLYSGELKNWRRLDIGANVVAGFEFNNGLFASGGYQVGLKDMNKTNANIKDRSLSVSVGYLLDLNRLTKKG